MRPAPQPDRRRLSATKAAAKAASSSRPSSHRRTTTASIGRFVVTLGPQALRELGAGARPVGQQAVGVGQGTIGVGVGAQGGELPLAQLEAHEQTVTHEQRFAHGDQEAAVDVHGHAAFAAGGLEGRDGRHDAGPRQVSRRWPAP